MKFRIIKYYDRYKTQVLTKGEWTDIGSPTGYYSVSSAKLACYDYKQAEEDKIIEEFDELFKRGNHGGWNV